MAAEHKAGFDSEDDDNFNVDEPPTKKVISVTFFLTINKKYPPKKYIVGFKKLIETRDKYFPTYSIWLYIDETVPLDHETRVLAHATPNVEVKYFSFPNQPVHVKCGARLLVLHDNTVEVALIRDLDAPLTALDAEYVTDFEQDNSVAILRYHEAFFTKKHLTKLGIHKNIFRTFDDVFPSTSDSDDEWENFYKNKTESDSEAYEQDDNCHGGGISVKLQTGLFQPLSLPKYADFIKQNPEWLGENEEKRGFDEHYITKHLIRKAPTTNVSVVMFISGNQRLKITKQRMGQWVTYKSVIANPKSLNDKEIVRTLLDFSG